MINYVISLLKKDFSFFIRETEVDSDLRKRLISEIDEEKGNGL